MKMKYDREYSRMYDECYVDSFGVKYSKDRKVLLQGNDMLEEYVVTEGTEIIVRFSDRNNPQLKSITLPDTLFRIEKGAFDGCDNLSITHIVGEINI